MSDVIIIGAGVIGLMTARELLTAGLRVRLFERGTAAKESSWAGGGILSPLYPWRSAPGITQLFLESRRLYPSLMAALREDTGIDPEWLRSGLLVCDAEDTAEAGNWCRAHGLECFAPSLSELAALEPALECLPSNPLCLPDIYQVRNPRLLRALRADVEARGGLIEEHREVLGFDMAAGKVNAIRTATGTDYAASYIITAGAWSGLFSRPVLADLPVEPVKGQMIVFSAEPGALRHIVLNQGRYLIPRKDGRIVVGSTVEHSDFDKSLSDGARNDLAEFAYSHMPRLKHCPIENHWAGLRPGSPEGVPFIGAHPDIGNLHFHCGHFRNGFVMAPASARLVADLLLNRPTAIDPSSYDLSKRH